MHWSEALERYGQLLLVMAFFVARWLMRRAAAKREKADDAHGAFSRQSQLWTDTT